VEDYIKKPAANQLGHSRIRRFSFLQLVE